MHGEAKLWIVIVLVGASNYLVRLSFIALLANAKIPALAQRALRFVAVAMLSALVVPMVIGATATPFNPRIAAALVAGVVASFTRSVGWTLAAGMGVLWTLKALE